MKRLIAYIGLLFTMILSICVLSKPIISSVNSGYDFGSAKQYVYQLTDLNQSITDQGSEALADGASEEIAKIFEDRLETYEVENYNIEIQGNNIISVSYSASSSLEYEHISSFLSFDGNLTLATYDNEYVFHNNRDTDNQNDAMFGVEEAYLEKKDIYPALIIPLEDVEKFQTAVEHAEELEDAETSDDEETSSEVSEKGRIYLWSNWQEGDDFDSAEDNVNIQRKLILYFNYNDIWYEENEEDRTSICTYFSVEGSDDAESIEDINWNNVATANENAKYFLNLLNASHLDYQVNLLYSNDVDPLVENLVTLDSTISVNYSTIMICFIASYFVIMIIAISLLRLNGFNLVLSSGFMFILLLGIINLIGTTFTVSTLIGIIISLIMFLSCSLIYGYKLKISIEKESKSLRKAYLDSSKSSTFLSLDISVIALILGSIGYLLGGSYISGFGIVLFFASILNAILTPLLNRLITYFFINTKYFSNHLSYLGVNQVEAEFNDANNQINNENIETKDEQTNKKKISKKGIIGIIYSCITLACVITISYFGATSSSYDYSSLINTNDKVYLRVDSKTDLAYSEISDVTNKLDLISYDGLTTEQKIYTSVKSHEYTDYTNPDSSGDSISVDYIIYEVDLSNLIDINENKFTYNNNGILQSNIAFQDALNQCFNELNVDIADVENFSTRDMFKISEITLVCSISLLVSCVYLCIRFGLSKGIGAFLIVVLNVAFTLSILAVIRIPVNMYVALASLISLSVSLFIITLINSYYKEAYNNENNTILNLEDKQKIISKINKIVSFACMIVISISFLITLIFTGFSVSTLQNVFAISMLSGVVLSSLMILILYDSISLYLNKLFIKLSSKTKTPKSKKKALKQQHKARQKGKELEEATFIGIND